MAGRVGQRFGDYRLVRFLGDGTFGDVYLGEQVYDKSPAAVKVFKTKLTPDRFKDFLNEVRTVLLKHPHIVQVLDFGMREDDIPFLVMEFAPNGTLLARHPRGTLLPLSTIVQYVKQIAAALQYAHDQRRIHRDIKPENILFGAKNELLLSDFGIAAVAHSTSSQKMEEAIGTALYMAPEQWKGKPLPASDQYALGIVVYEWLSGKCPFAGAGLQLMYQHLEAPPPPIRTKVPTLSPEVEEVILTALAKDPKTRFGSVQAFATALQEAGTAPQQATIYPPAQPGRTSIPPTVPVRPVSGEAVVAESVVTPPIPPITQPESLPLPPHPQTDPVLFPPPGYPAAEVATPALPYPKTPAANPISPQKKLAKRGISRRAVMRIGFAVAGVAVVGVGGVTLLLNKTSHLQIGALLATYTGHSNLVTAVSWSPNGQLIASGSADHTVQVWNATTGNAVYTYTGHSYGVTAVTWSPNGQYIASGSEDNTVQVWNATTGGNIYTYTSHSDTDTVTALSWSPDGTRIASGSSDKTVQVWNATTGKHIYIYLGHSNLITAVSWSPNGQYIASGSSDKTVQVWEATTGKHIYTYLGHSSPVDAVAWSPDGKRIASGSNDKTVQVWDATTGAHAYTYTGHTDSVTAVAWSPDGKLIASGSSDDSVQVWRTEG